MSIMHPDNDPQWSQHTHPDVSGDRPWVVHPEETEQGSHSWSGPSLPSLDACPHCPRGSSRCAHPGWGL